MPRTGGRSYDQNEAFLDCGQLFAGRAAWERGTRFPRIAQRASRMVEGRPKERYPSWEGVGEGGAGRSRPSLTAWVNPGHLKTLFPRRRPIDFNRFRAKRSAPPAACVTMMEVALIDLRNEAKPAPLRNSLRPNRNHARRTQPPSTRRKRTDTSATTRP